MPRTHPKKGTRGPNNPSGHPDTSLPEDRTNRPRETQGPVSWEPPLLAFWGFNRSRDTFGVNQVGLGKKTSQGPLVKEWKSWKALVGTPDKIRKLKFRYQIPPIPAGARPRIIHFFPQLFPRLGSVKARRKSLGRLLG